MDAELKNKHAGREYTRDELDLKPCPFCGSEHIALYSNDAEQLYSIECEDCGCGTCCHLEAGIAADVWNMRVGHDRD